jgi:CBS domain-containing protein
MHAVPHQVINFLAASAPFDKLKTEQLVVMAKQCSVLYLTAQNAQAMLTDNKESLFLIQSGQFSIQEQDGVQSYLSEGDYFGIAVCKQNYLLFFKRIKSKLCITRLLMIQTQFGCTNRYQKY